MIYLCRLSQSRHLSSLIRKVRNTWIRTSRQYNPALNIQTCVLMLIWPAGVFLMFFGCCVLMYCVVLLCFQHISHICRYSDKPDEGDAHNTGEQNMFYCFIFVLFVVWHTAAHESLLCLIVRKQKRQKKKCENRRIQRWGEHFLSHTLETHKTSNKEMWT